MAVRRWARLKVPGTSGCGGLRAASPLTGRERPDGVWQRASLAKERSMDRRRSVRVQVAESPRLALGVGGLEVVQQLLVIQVPQPRAIVRHPVSISGDKEVLLLIAVRALVHQ